MPILKILLDDKLIELPFDGEILLADALGKAGFPLNAPCGGKGKCGKCKVNLQNENGEYAPVLACKTLLNRDTQVKLPASYGKSLVIEGEIGDIGELRGEFDFGVALDIGTTTIAAKLFSGGGKVIAQAVTENPQRSIAADVIGRIDSAINGNGEKLKSMAVLCINQCLDELCEKASVNKTQINRMVVCGNTAMLYLLCGHNPKSIATAPFKADCLFGEYINRPLNAYLPKCIDGFLGADLTCGVIASGMCEKTETALLCDIGTNGEIALWKQGRLYATSAAAGPAFEGGEISCGCPCVAGAVDRVEVIDGRIVAHTQGDEEAIGICGSGLIDAVAVLLKMGYMDASGTAPQRLNLPVKGNGVYITREDIVALQYAKSAVRSAIDMLLSETDTEVSEVDRLYLSGGFGTRLNLDSAVEIGLIPEMLKEKVVQMGNGALKGAAMMLFDDEYCKKCEEIAEKAIHIQLGGRSEFEKSFVANLKFEKI